MDDPGRRLARFGHLVCPDICRVLGLATDLPLDPSIYHPDGQAVRCHAYPALSRTALQHLRSRKPAVSGTAIRCQPRHRDCPWSRPKQRHRPGRRPVDHRDRFRSGDHDLAALETWRRDGRSRIPLYHH